MKDVRVNNSSIGRAGSWSGVADLLRPLVGLPVSFAHGHMPARTRTADGTYWLAREQKDAFEIFHRGFPFTDETATTMIGRGRNRKSVAVPTVSEEIRA